MAVIVANATIQSSFPLFIEIMCETSYPVGEGVVSGFLGMIVHLGSAVSLVVDQLIPTGKNALLSTLLVYQGRPNNMIYCFRTNRCSLYRKVV